MTRALRLAGAALVAVALTAPPAVAQVKSWPSEAPPKPLATRPFTFPPYQIRTLPNGLQVVVVEHHEQPAVSVRMLIKAGMAQDPAGRSGVANMVAQLLDQGTTSRSAQQIAEAVDAMGGDLQIAAGTDVSSANIRVMKDGFSAGLDLLSEIVRSPAFANEELERQRAQLRSALKVGYEDPDYLARMVFERLVYGAHPYGLPGNGTPDSIERITRDDLSRFHDLYFAPNNAMLAVVGDVAVDEAFAAALKTFGNWAPHEVPAFTPQDTPPPGRRVVVVDKPDAVQTAIRIGHLAFARKNPDYDVTDLAIRILGGEGGNRLQQVLRMQRGLTYDASADLETFQQIGHIVAGTDTRSETTGEALRVMVDEFARFQREAVEPRELSDAKAYVAGSFPLSIETPDAIASRVLNALFYGLPLDELQTYRERITAVSIGDITRVSRAYLWPDRLAIVLVGNAEDILGQLRREGFRDVDVVKLEALDILAPNLKRARAPGVPALSQARGTPALPMPLDRPTPEEWGRARAVVMRAADACGGLEALERIRTIRAIATTVLTTPEGPVTARTQTFIEYPARMRVEAQLPRGEIVQVYADGAAWIRDPTGTRDAPPAMKDEFAAGVRRDWVALLVAAATDRLTGRRLDDERGLGGRALQVVELWSDQLPRVRLAIEAETGRLAWLSYRGAQGGETTVEAYDDFRANAGITIPYRAVITRDAQPLLERWLVEVEINVPLSPSLFRKLQ